MNLRSLATLGAGLLAAGALTGCSVGPSIVNGKVIRGDISFIVMVDATDPRLKGEGLPGAAVDLYSSNERGATLLSHAVSDAKGNLVFSIKEGDVLMQPAEFDAAKEGFARTSTVMAIPPVDKRVLVILKPNGSSPAR